MSWMLLVVILLISLFEDAAGLRRGGRGQVNIKPPDINQRSGGGGGENGYRLLTSDECKSVSTSWRKRIGVLDSNGKIELFEMLNIIERGSEVMPGKEPQRKELLAFGEFQDGNVVCVCMGYLYKCKCPWDLSVRTMAHMDGDLVMEENMVAFIKEVCIEHACVPDYSFLERWELFAGRKWIRSPRKLAEQKAAELEKSISTYYTKFNKAPSIVLDHHELEYLGPYWYKLRVPNDRLPVNNRPNLYFRQKSLDIRDEFEVRFYPPVTGVSSGRGTVGAAIIIDTDDDESFQKFKCSDSTINDAKLVASEITRRIKHPPEIVSYNEEEDTTKERIDYSMDGLTGKEMLKKLRDDYNREKSSN